MAVSGKVSAYEVKSSYTALLHKQIKGKPGAVSQEGRAILSLPAHFILSNKTEKPAGTFLVRLKRKFNLFPTTKKTAKEFFLEVSKYHLYKFEIKTINSAVLGFNNLARKEREHSVRCFLI